MEAHSQIAAQFWKPWEGQVVAQAFPLRRYLGGGDDSGVFLTELGEGKPRTAVIKLLPDHPGTAGLQLARWKEAEQLSHPNLLRVFDSGRCRLGDAALLYVVEEFADDDLSRILPQRALTEAETRQMLAPVADALGYLHAKGFVHGHLKPANIMATGDTVKVSTDGIRPIGEAVEMSGPRAYDAPELARGQSTPAGDVWALGVTLVEALTQRCPDWKAASQRDPALPDTLSGPFAEIAGDCLRVNPERRPSLTEVVARVYGPIAPARDRGAVASLAPKPRYGLWLLAAVAGLAAIFVGRSLVNRPAAAPSVNPPKQTTVTPPPAPATPRPQPPPAAPRPQEVVHQVMPDVSSQALHTIHGRVRVRVRVEVDPSGAISGAHLDVAGPSHYFAEAALRAARQWKFSPNPEQASSTWLLHFVFRRSGATVEPVEVKR